MPANVTFWYRSFFSLFSLFLSCCCFSTTANVEAGFEAGSEAIDWSSPGESCILLMHILDDKMQVDAEMKKNTCDNLFEY